MLADMTKKPGEEFSTRVSPFDQWLAHSHG